ncbi:MAG TPA: PAS domain S-box protein, partial [Dehalococcoidia bacterium]|nr:PAS domain S-box protein [Dehalococcoidia bacterium]
MDTAGTWHSPRTRAGGIVTAAVSLSALYLLSRYNYLLFHCSVEFFGVFAAVTIFVIAWHTRIWTPNHYLLFLGIAYLFVGIIDGTHTLAYKGMGVFPTSGANEATQLWILACYTEAFSLLAAPLFITRRMRVAPLISLYAAVSGFGLLAIWRLGIFPDCFIEGQGLTPFKIASEYVIAAVLAGAIAHLLKHRARLAPRVVTLLVAAMALTIAAEMAFTLYTDVYGVSNMVGHLLKAVSFYLVYRAVVLTSLVTPYSLVFRDLKEARARVERERDMAQQYLDIAGMILVVLDTAGRVSLINKKGADILGYPAEEIVGRDWFADFIPESQREAVSSVFQQLVAGQVQPVEYVQNAVLTRGGEERTIAWHNAVVRDQAGAVTATLSSGEDVTERLHTEKALRESEERFRSLFENSRDAIYI